VAPKLQFGLHIGFLVDASLHERITQVTKAQGCTMSDVIRAALERHLTRPDNPAPKASQSAPNLGGKHAEMGAQA
jgi:hypothetical protein